MLSIWSAWQASECSCQLHTDPLHHLLSPRSHAARDMSTAGAPSSSHLLHSNSHGHGSPGSAADNKALPVIKMTEKFARNPALPADADVAKRVYHVAAGKTLVQYHYGEGRVTASFRTFQKDGPAQAVQVSVCYMPWCNWVYK